MQTNQLSFETCLQKDQKFIFRILNLFEIKLFLLAQCHNKRMMMVMILHRGTYPENSLSCPDHYDVLHQEENA